MTAKRFVVEKYSVRDMSIDEKYVNSSYYIGDKGIAQRLCDLLNELNDECEFLKIDNESLEHGATKYAELCHETLKENKRLKKEAEEYNEDAMSYQTLYEQQLETIHRLKKNIDELLSVDIEEELLKENERLKKDLEHCANRFADDGKNVLLSLR